ncbi:MAG: hypothetical protein OEU54_04355 [Gemmatimonadota bacterium]|nr:hypothetical protein [Gemmatimonadota bacterium]
MSGRRDRREDSAWPAWLEALRPDEVTRQRLHNRVMTTAETMLRLPERTWSDVTAGWSSVLTPLAAGLAVAFGVLAYRASIDPEIESMAATEPASIERDEIQPLLGSEDTAPPALLIDEDELNGDAVLRAALVSTLER